jgi:hypothetical protein
MTEIVLTGLDGSNPLAFLAALGVVEALTDDGLPIQLRWENRGIWTPILRGEGFDLERLLARLDADRERRSSESVLQLEYDGKRDVRPPLPRFREFLLEQAASCSPEHRTGADWAAAFGSDAIADGSGTKTKPTALHFVAGQQQFLAMALQLASETSREHLREALFGPWTYSSPLPVMGWDATAAREYALRADNPSGDKKTGNPGAEWLAFRSLTALPTAPASGALRTAACSGGWKSGYFRWPLWRPAIGREVVRTLLSRSWGEAEDRRKVPPSIARREIGIHVLFRSRIVRHDTGGRGTMSPSEVVI